MTIKVLHAAEVVKGGVAAVVRRLVTGQMAADSAIQASCYVPDSQASELVGLPATSITTFRRTGRNVGSLCRFAIGLARRILMEKPDIVHLHSTFAGFLGRTVILLVSPFHRVKVVYCPHAFSFLMKQSAIKNRIFSVLERVFALLTDRIVCVSEYERVAGVGAGIPSAKLTLIYNGSETRPRVLRPNDRMTNVLFVGRLDYQKGFDTLLAAFASLRETPVSLTVAGGDQPPGETEPKIRYLGWVAPERIATVYELADVLVMPSRWEGFPMTALEAMSEGLAIVASNNSSFPEVITHGSNGYLFPEGDAVQLAKILRDTPLATWRELGAESRRIFITQFTESVMVKKTNTLYRELLKKT